MFLPLHSAKGWDLSLPGLDVYISYKLKTSYRSRGQYVGIRTYFILSSLIILIVDYL